MIFNETSDDKHRTGFSLIKYGLPLILIAIIGVFAFRSYQSSMVTGHQTSATSIMRDLYNREVEFRMINRRYATLEELSADGLIDKELASGVKDGYRFEIDAKGDSFEIHATPLIYGGTKSTGTMSFYMNQANVFTVADKGGGKASPNDTPVKE